MRSYEQPSAWYKLTRRGAALKSKVDVETYRKGRSLPVELLSPILAEKSYPIFLRGDYDVAVFQAFKEVEVAVRKKGAYPDSLIGRDLMQKAFHPEIGRLRNVDVIPAEREAEMFLFSGAIGHCKNPPGHRDVDLAREESARLIIFASYLLGIVDRRAIQT